MLSLLLLLCAIPLLSLAMNKHYKSTFGRPIKDKLSTTLKSLGWTALVLSVVTVSPTPINYVTWVLELSLVILLQAWFLSLIQQDKKRR